MANLPDLVIDQIFRRLTTTKAAVRLSFMSKQWEGIFPSLPILNFEESGDQPIKRHKRLARHKRFVRFLERYLEHIKEKDRKSEKATPLVKFRLHMTRYSSKDARVVSELYSSSIERSVEELDISLGGAIFSRANFMNAKTLTTLNLENVKMNKIYDRSVSPDFSISPCLLPCLKAMSFKNVHFDLDALFVFVQECPSIEHLSLDSSSFKSSRNFELYLVSQSLKSLEIKHCTASKAELNVENLESLTVVSSDELKTLKLERNLELKHVNIFAQRLEEISIHAEYCNVNAIIDAPALECMWLTSCLGFRFSLKTTPRLPDAIIKLLVSKDESPSSGPWKHFPELADFLLQFGDFQFMKLYAEDFRDLIFPKDFRKTVASPMLQNLDDLEYGSPNRPRTYEDSRDLRAALCWMAPHVISPRYTGFVNSLSMVPGGIKYL